MTNKTVILTEGQFKKICEEIAGSEILKPEDKNCVPVRYPVNPEKVLLVKGFLDKTFQPGMMDCVGDDGMPSQQRIVKMLSLNGEVLKLMYIQDAIDLLIEKYKNMFLNHDERNRFLNQVFNDWYDGKISAYGLLSKNYV